MTHDLDVTTGGNLVLIGGGHTHVHVLKSFGLRPMPGVRLTLVARDVQASYSGMLPGYIAGHYTHSQCHIDLAPLARFAGAELIHDEAVGLDRAAKHVVRKGGAAVPYDIVSIDIGSTPKLGLVPGAAEHATPVKPIAGLAARWARIMERVGSNERALRFVTVGGGAAGVELTLAMQHRLGRLLRELGQSPDALAFTIVTAGEILPGTTPRHGVELSLCWTGAASRSSRTIPSGVWMRPLSPAPVAVKSPSTSWSG